MAHNLKVVGSNPTPATKSNQHIKTLRAALRAAFCVPNSRSTIGQQNSANCAGFQHVSSQTRTRPRENGSTHRLTRMQPVYLNSSQPTLGATKRKRACKTMRCRDRIAPAISKRGTQAHRYFRTDAIPARSLFQRPTRTASLNPHSPSNPLILLF